MDALVVDRASTAAPWEQVHDQLLALVDDGFLAPGSHLPPVRALAERLGVAAGTVARAYRQLEAAGVVATARRAGTVVRDRSGPGDDAPARAAAGELARVAVASGLDDEAVLTLVRGALGLARRS